MKRFLLTDKLFLKLTIALIIGIYSIAFFEVKLALCIPILTFGILQLGIHLFKVNQPKLIEHILFVSFIYLSMGLHYLNSSYHFQTKSIHHAQFVDKEVPYLFRIDEKPIRRSSSTKIQGALVAVKISDSTIPIHNQMILYLPSEIQTDSWAYGDHISLYGKINSPLPPLNPEEFDYKSWLYRNHIYLTAYSTQIKKTQFEVSWIQNILYFPLKARDYFENELTKYIPTKQNLNIAKSLLIGVRSDMDQEILDAYSATGTIHILSVSGTHFAVFFFMLSLFFKRLPKRFEYASFFIKQMLCFGYALITGFSPPVFRSFLMLFFVDLKNVTHSRPNSFNILFFTASIILLYDTNQLFDIGFLLSYQSVLGLMLFYRKIFQKLEFKNWVAIKIWEIASGSFAAWSATVPLSIFFFHKFSLLGMLSNLFVVPISFGILCTGYIFLVLSKIKFIGITLGWFIDKLLSLQNGIISFFEKIPFAFIDNLYLNIFQTLVLTILVYLCIKFMIQKTRSSLYACGFCFILFLGSVLIHKHQAREQNGWILFNMRKKTTYGYKHQNHFILFADSMDKKTYDFSIKPFVCLHHIDSIQKVPLHTKFIKIPMKIGIDTSQHPQYLILSKENKPYWKKKRQFESPIILSKNMGFYYRNKIKNEIQLTENQNMLIQEDTSRAFVWME